MMLMQGDTAPPFEMAASGGRTISSAALSGRPYVLYFYPKADTPGCTTEACAFQEALPQLGHIGVDVIGVSRDPMPPIEKFAARYGLTFPLASDPGGLAEAYGVWGGEVDVRQDVHGNAAGDVPGGPRRHHRAGMACGESGRPRRRGRRGGGRTRLSVGPRDDTARQARVAPAAREGQYPG